MNEQTSKTQWVAFRSQSPITKATKNRMAQLGFVVVEERYLLKKTTQDQIPALLFMVEKVGNPRKGWNKDMIGIAIDEEQMATISNAWEIWKVATPEQRFNVLHPFRGAVADNLANRVNIPH